MESENEESDYYSLRSRDVKKTPLSVTRGSRRVRETHDTPLERDNIMTPIIPSDTMTPKVPREDRCANKENKSLLPELKEVAEEVYKNSQNENRASLEGRFLLSDLKETVDEIYKTPQEVRCAATVYRSPLTEVQNAGEKLNNKKNKSVVVLRSNFNRYTEYKKTYQERIRAMKEKKEMEEKRKMLEEKKRLAEYRKTLQFKARPMPNFSAPKKG